MHPCYDDETYATSCAEILWCWWCCFCRQRQQWQLRQSVWSCFFFLFSMLWFWRGRTLTCVCVIWNWWIYIFCEMFPNEEKDDCDIIWNRGGVSAVDNGLHTKCTAFLYEMCYFSFIGRFGRQQQNDFITFDFTPSKNHHRLYEAVLSGTPIKIYIIFCWLQLPNVVKWK